MKSDNNITKRELRKYSKQVRERAKKFKLKSEDAHNLYDLYWMTNRDLRDTLKINKMDKWFHNFIARVEKVILGKNLAFK